MTGVKKKANNSFKLSALFEYFICFVLSKKAYCVRASICSGVRDSRSGVLE